MSYLVLILQDRLQSLRIGGMPDQVFTDGLVNSISESPRLLAEVDPTSQKTPLEYAAENGMWGDVELMIDTIALKSYQFNSSYFESISAGKVLLKALKENKSVAAKMLTLGVPAVWNDREQNTCLHWAVINDLPHLIPSIIKNECNISKRNTQGFTALELAIRQNKINAVEAIINNLNKHDRAANLRHAIYYAAEYSDINIIKKLRELGAKITLSRYEKTSDLIDTIARDLTDVGSTYWYRDIKHRDLNFRQSDSTIFELAAQYNSPEVLAFLIEEADEEIKLMADKNAASKRRRIFLDVLYSTLYVTHQLKRTECTLVIAKLFRKNRAEFDKIADHDLVATCLKPILIEVINSNQNENIDLLLNSSHQISRYLTNWKLNDDIGTILHYLAHQNNSTTIKKILAAGGYQKMRNRKGQFPIDVAILHQSWETAKALIEDANFEIVFATGMAIYARTLLTAGQFQLLDILLSKNAKIDVNEKNDQGSSFIHLIADDPRFTSFALLENRFINFKLTNQNRLTPYQIAMKRGNFAFLTWMYQHHKNQLDFVQVVEVFSLAVSKNQIELVELMLKNEPSLCHFYDRQGNNYLNIAAKRGHEEMVKVLLRHGANAFRALRNGKCFIENARDQSFPIDPNLLNDLETTKIKSLSSSISLKYQELLSNHYDHDRHRTLSNKIVLDSILMIRVICSQLKAKQKKMSEPNTKVPSNLVDHSNQEMERLIELFTGISSNRRFLNELRSLQPEIDRMSLPEAKVLSQYLRRLNYIHSILLNLDSLNAEFVHSVSTMRWKKRSMLGIFIDEKPTHIEELLKKLDNELKNPTAVLGEKYDIRHIDACFQIIRDELNKAQVSDGNHRHPSTVSFYNNWSKRYNSVLFSENTMDALLTNDLYAACEQVEQETRANPPSVDPLAGIALSVTDISFFDKAPPAITNNTITTTEELYPFEALGMTRPVSSDEHASTLPTPSAPSINEADRLYLYEALGFERETVLTTTTSTTTTTTSTVPPINESCKVTDNAQAALAEFQLETIKSPHSGKLIWFEELEDELNNLPTGTLIPFYDLATSDSKKKESPKSSYQVPSDVDVDSDSFSSLCIEAGESEDDEETLSTPSSPSVLRTHSLIQTHQPSSHDHDVKEKQTRKGMLLPG